MAATNFTLPTAADVDAAAPRLKGVAVRTPLINSPVLDAAVGARVFLKAETLQRTGSIRPATTRRALPLRRNSSACAPPS
jgi:threonine dehydratase